jgi:hypothetical protein
VSHIGCQRTYGLERAAATAQFVVDAQGRERRGWFCQRSGQFAAPDWQGFAVDETVFDRASRQTQ